MYCLLIELPVVRMTLLHRAGGDAVRQRPLEEEEEDQGRHDTDQRGGGRGRHIHQTVAGQRGDGDRDGLRGVVDQEGHRNHVVVPSPDEEEHQHDGQGRLRNREDDILENLPADCAIDGGRFQNRLGKVPYTDDNRYVPNALGSR